MLPKKRRLTTALFDQVFKTGKSEHGDLFLFRSTPHLSSSVAKKAKFAVTVSKKVVSSAVGRNSIKRKVYGVLEKIVPQDYAGTNAVIVVKKDIRKLSSSKISAELTLLLKKVLK